jgi:hypothetical protein
MVGVDMPTGPFGVVAVGVAIEALGVVKGAPDEEVVA